MSKFKNTIKRNLRLWTIGALSATASVIAPSTGSASITICNDSENPVLISVATQRLFQNFTDTWTLSGWYELNGNCQTITGGEQVLQEAFVVVFRQENGRWENLKAGSIEITEKYSTFNKSGNAILETSNGYNFCLEKAAFEKDFSGFPDRDGCKEDEISASPLFYVFHPATYYFAEVSIGPRGVRMRAR